LEPARVVLSVKGRASYSIVRETVKDDAFVKGSTAVSSSVHEVMEVHRGSLANEGT
jgi:hypothetical protein